MKRSEVLAKEKQAAIGRKPYGVRCLNCHRNYTANKQYSLCPHDFIETKP